MAVPSGQHGPQRAGRRLAVWASLPFQGALATGCLTAAAAFGAGKFLEWRWHGEAVRARAASAAVAARALEEAVAPLLGSVQRRGIEAALARQLQQLPGASGRILDSRGREVCRGGPDAAALEEAPERPAPVHSGVVAGSVGGQPVLEARQDVRGERGPAGAVQVRVPAPPAPASGPVAAFAAAAGLFGLVAAAVYLAGAMRPSRSIVRALERAAREEFWHRAVVTGCGDLRAVALAANETLTSLESAAVRVQRAYVETAKALVRAVEAKDRYTSGHSQRVARYAVEMGRWLGFDKDRLDMLELGALLHDLGKVGVPDAVLTKQGPLTDAEFVEMKKHPVVGERILAAIPGLRDIADMARSHHERWAGGGYPLGVSGEAIPLEGRIIAIADAYDALVTRRSYKPALPVEQALREIEKGAGTHLDPDLARLFVSMKRNGKGYKAVRRGVPAAALGESEAEWAPERVMEPEDAASDPSGGSGAGRGLPQPA